MSEVFSEADLEPSGEDRRALRRQRLDRAAASAAAVAAGILPGGLVALGACAAPFVFRMTPSPWSGHAMAAAFARWDRVALGCALVVLVAEMVRTFLGGARARRPLPRVRRLAAVALAAGVAYQAFALTPSIRELHEGGASRGVGQAGQRMEAIHQRASLVGRAVAGLALAVVVLHVWTLSRPRPEDEEDQAAAPLPPGPRP